MRFSTVATALAVGRSAMAAPAPHKDHDSWGHDHKIAPKVMIVSLVSLGNYFLAE